METKHSPAPWESCNGTILDTNRNQVAHLPHGWQTHDVRAANMRLIENAPELLDFVRRWRDEVLGGDDLEKIDGWARSFLTEAGELLLRTDAKL